MSKYDVIIIGSGLGGLTCGATLSKEGYNVCVIEKNPVPGGCFQTFHHTRHGEFSFLLKFKYLQFFAA